MTEHLDGPGSSIPITSELLPERFWQYREIGFVPCGPGWIVRDPKGVEAEVIGWSHQEIDLESALNDNEDLYPGAGQDLYDAALRLSVDERRHWLPVAQFSSGAIAETVPIYWRVRPRPLMPTCFRTHISQLRRTRRRLTRRLFVPFTRDPF